MIYYSDACETTNLTKTVIKELLISPQNYIIMNLLLPVWHIPVDLSKLKSYVLGYFRSSEVCRFLAH